MLVQLTAVIFFGLASIWFGIRVFVTKSMVRSALALLGSMAALGMLFLALEAEFLGVLQLMMMSTEMAVMAIFMVMFMMDPGGLGQMEMTHQKRLAFIVGTIGAVSAAAFALLIPWDAGGVLINAAPAPGKQLHDLGIEIMSRSMLIFETAGVTILVTMIGAIMLGIPERVGQKREKDHSLMDPNMVMDHDSNNKPIGNGTDAASPSAQAGNQAKPPAPLHKETAV